MRLEDLAGEPQECISQRGFEAEKAPTANYFGPWDFSVNDPKTGCWRAKDREGLQQVIMSLQVAAPAVVTPASKIRRPTLSMDVSRWAN